MLIAPMPINQGRSFFFTKRSLGLMMRMPAKRRRDVARSRQKAKPTAERPLFLMMRLMKIPEVDQQMVAVITSKMPESLDEIGLRFVRSKGFSFLLRERVACLRYKIAGIVDRYPDRFVLPSGPVFLPGQIPPRSGTWLRRNQLRWLLFPQPLF